MKKILMLALVVLVAGAAFAATDPVFSGKFSTTWSYSFSDGSKWSDGVGNSAKVDLKATIDDFNTVDVKMETGKAVQWDDANKDKVIDLNELSEGGMYLKLNEFTLKTDVTGALGLDLPVSLGTEMGKFEMKAPSVADVAPYTLKVAEDSKTDKLIGIGFNLGVLDMVTLGTVLYPVNAFEDKKVESGAWLKATGIIDMIDVAAYFIASDSKNDNLGANVAAAPMDGLKLGVGFNYNMDAMNTDAKEGVASMKFDASYTGVENLTAGLSYMVADFTEFVGTSKVAVAAEYKILEALSVYGGAWMAFAAEGVDWEVATGLGYDAGIMTSLGALKVTMGASDNMKYKAPEKDYDDALYIKFSAEF